MSPVSAPVLQQEIPEKPSENAFRLMAESLPCLCAFGLIPWDSSGWPVGRSGANRSRSSRKWLLPIHGISGSLWTDKGFLGLSFWEFHLTLWARMTVSCKRTRCRA